MFKSIINIKSIITLKIHVLSVPFGIMLEISFCKTGEIILSTSYPPMSMQEPGNWIARPSSLKLMFLNVGLPVQDMIVDRKANQHVFLTFS